MGNKTKRAAGYYPRSFDTRKKATKKQRTKQLQEAHKKWKQSPAGIAWQEAHRKKKAPSDVKVEILEESTEEPDAINVENAYGTFLAGCFKFSKQS